MDPITIAAIMSAAGGAKGYAETKTNREQKLLQAEQRPYGMYTGYYGKDPDTKGDILGGAVAGGMQGFMLGKNIQQSELMNKLMTAQTANQLAQSNSVEPNTFYKQAATPLSKTNNFGSPMIIQEGQAQPVGGLHDYFEGPLRSAPQKDQYQMADYMLGPQRTARGRY